MDKQRAKWARRRRRRLSARRRIEGTPERPRLAIYRSSKHIYAQVIDDLKGHTLAAASTVSENPSGAGVDKAQAVGKAVAEKAKAAGVSKVVFDRGGSRYHGRIKALADAAREGGLDF
jgi:large subunit ribosomal protein L18